MRGPDDKQDGMFSYVSADKRVPLDHPLRKIRPLVDQVLKEMSPQFGKLYSEVGRPSIAPERLLRALLLQIFYSIRSERLLVEQLDYNMLFRWFVGMSMDEEMWVPTVFTKNRDRAETLDRQQLLCTGVQARRAVSVGRALHGGRDADRGMGFAEEFSAQGR